MPWNTPLTFPDHYLLVPEGEIRARLAAFRPVAAQAAEAALLSWPPDLYYFTGTTQNGYLLLSPHQEPLFLVRRSPRRARAEGPLPVRAINSFRDVGRAVQDHLGRFPRRLGLALDVLPFRVAQGLGELLGGPELVDLSAELLAQRSAKSAWELQRMAEAADLNTRVMDLVPDLFRPGLTELDLGAAMMKAYMEAGGQAVLRTRAVGQDMYLWHIISGSRGFFPSWVEAPFGGLGQSPAFSVGASQEPIKQGEPIQMDFGAAVRGYHVDVTRMFCWGRPPERALQAYKALLAIQAAVMEALRPGAVAAEVFDLAVAEAEGLGFGQEFLGRGEDKIKFVGHGVGLEMSEPPFLAQGRREVLKEGQTVALELKMVLEGVGAVGLENTVALAGSGPVKLSRAGEEFRVF